MEALLHGPVVEQRTKPRARVGWWRDVSFVPLRRAPEPAPRTGLQAAGEFALACVLTPLNFVAQALLWVGAMLAVPLTPFLAPLGLAPVVVVFGLVILGVGAVLTALGLA